MAPDGIAVIVGVAPGAEALLLETALSLLGMDTGGGTRKPRIASNGRGERGAVKSRGHGLRPRHKGGLLIPVTYIQDLRGRATGGREHLRRASGPKRALHAARC